MSFICGGKPQIITLFESVLGSPYLVGAYREIAEERTAPNRKTLGVQTYPQQMFLSMNISTTNLEVKPDTNSLTTPVAAPEGDDPAATYSSDDIVADDSVSQNYGNEVPSSPSTKMDQDVDQLITQLSRPVYVGSFNPAATITLGWQPWHTWLMNNFVASKLAYFRYVRFDITIRTSVSTSPYNCGRGLLYYVPCASGAPNVGASLPISSAVTVQYSALMDLSESKSYDLTIPFHGITDYVDRTNIVSAGDPTSTPLNGLPVGYVNYRVLGSMRNINAATPTASTAVVYVLASNIKLVFPMFPQMKSNKSEVSSKPGGKISGAATTVARIANAASNIPMLSGVAKATELAAQGVATVASLFGYSNPVVVAREGVVVGPQSFTNSNVEQPGHKLSLDAKQELALGHHVFDGDTDTLGVGFLTRKWGLLAYDSIDTTTAAVGLKIAGKPLSPSWLIPNANADTAYEHTPLSYAALFFKYWRGSIELYIDFNITKYHRGKVAVLWVPEDGVTPSLIDHINTTPIVIHDLANGPSIHVKFPYISDVSWGQTGVFQTRTTPPWDYAKFMNPIGYYVLAMIEPIVCPGVTKVVDYQIYVRGGDDFEFAVPSRYSSQLVPATYGLTNITTRFEFSSANYPIDISTLDEGTFDEDWHNGIESYDFQIQLPDDKLKEIMPMPQPLNSVGMETMGERIVSLRSVFKRFAPLVCPDLTWNQYLTIALPAKPLGPSYDGILTAKPSKFEIAPYVLYGYLFDYWRGTIRYLFVGNDSKAARISAEDIVAPGIATSASLSGGSNYMKLNGRLAGYTPIGIDSNSQVPVDVPFQSRFQWGINAPGLMYGINVGEMGTVRGVVFRNFRNNAVPPEIHTAIGEDFSYRDFKWIPIMNDITAVIG